MDMDITIKKELVGYRKVFENELHDNILSYWMTYGVEKDRNDKSY